jgi:hypothetical protein
MLLLLMLRLASCPFCAAVVVVVVVVVVAAAVVVFVAAVVATTFPLFMYILYRKCIPCVNLQLQVQFTFSGKQLTN